MNVLLSLLQKSTDYNQLLKAVEAKQAVAVSGLSQAPRSHVLAAAHEQSGRPLIAVCQDDMAVSDIHPKGGVGQGFDHDALQLDHIIFCQDLIFPPQVKCRLPSSEFPVRHP